MAEPPDLIVHLRAFATELAAYQDTYQAEWALITAAADALTAQSTLLRERDALRIAARQLRNRIVAIRDAAEKPPRDFNLAWQLGRLIDDIETAFNLGASANLDAALQSAAPSQETV